jgi:hypothetical protein
MYPNSIPTTKINPTIERRRTRSNRVGRRIHEGTIVRKQSIIGISNHNDFKSQQCMSDNIEARKIRTVAIPATTDRTFGYASIFIQHFPVIQ